MDTHTQNTHVDTHTHSHTQYTHMDTHIHTHTKHAHANTQRIETHQLVQCVHLTGRIKNAAAA